MSDQTQRQDRVKAVLFFCGRKHLEMHEIIGR